MRLQPSLSEWHLSQCLPGRASVGLDTPGLQLNLLGSERTVMAADVSLIRSRSTALVEHHLTAVLGVGLPHQSVFELLWGSFTSGSTLIPLKCTKGWNSVSGFVAKPIEAWCYLGAEKPWWNSRLTSSTTVTQRSKAFSSTELCWKWLPWI